MLEQTHPDWSDALSKAPATKGPELYQTAVRGMAQKDPPSTKTE